MSLMPRAGRRSYKVRLCLAGLTLALATAMMPAMGRTASAQDGPQVGAYLWGGMLRQGRGLDRFHASMGFLLQQGFHAVRFTVSSNSLDELGVNQAQCGVTKRSDCFLGQVLDNPVFDDPRLTLLMITLHETASREVLAKGMTSERRDEVTQELRQALEQLRQRFSGRTIKLVLSNWEGDNMVYCGGVFQYMRSAGFATRCGAGDGTGLQRRLANFVAWMQLRDSVVREFRVANPGIDIEHAPEFNIAQLNTARCATACDSKATVFEALAREGKRPLCSYSSYNSTNRRALRQDLPRLLQSCDQVILGELGFAEARRGAEQVRQGFTEAAEAVAAHPGRVPAVIIWNAFNQPGRTREDSFGLFREDGSPGNIRNLPNPLRPTPSR